VYLLLGPSTALYLQWVCGGLDALVRQSSTESKVVQPFDDEDAIEKQYAELYGKKESATVKIEDDLYV